MPEKSTFDFQSWYAENKDDVNARRRAKYRDDPEHQKKVKAWNRRSREKKRDEAAAERERESDAVKVKGSQRWKTVEVEVDGVKVTMFTIGALAQAIGKGISTIRVWERSGVLPETPHRSAKGDRLYTYEMVEAVREALREAGKLSPHGLKPKPPLPYLVRTIRFANGERVKMKLYKISTLAKAINRTVAAVVQMEGREAIPPTPLRASSLRIRLYTSEMVLVVQKAFQRRGGDVRGRDDRSAVFEEVEDGWEKLGVMGAVIDEG